MHRLLEHGLRTGLTSTGVLPIEGGQIRHAYGTDTFLRDLLVAADRAPSVHNTRPTRWRWAPDGGLWVGADTSRHLPGSDPHQQDMGISAGAAVMTTLVALAAAGHPGRVELLWDQDDHQTWPGHRMVACIRPRCIPESSPRNTQEGTQEDTQENTQEGTPEGTQGRTPNGGPNDASDGVSSSIPYDDLSRLAPCLGARRTWRRGFRRPSPTEQATIDAWAGALPDAAWITGNDAKALVALGDTAALAQLRVPAVRHELAAWMRPNTDAPDGLTAQALGMSPMLCRAARVVLATPAFTLLDRMGAMPAFVTESEASAGMAGLLVIHTPKEACAVTGGMLLARLWLEATALGLAGWPMAALLDHAPTQNQLRAYARVGPERRVVMALRLGFPDQEDGADHTFL